MREGSRAWASSTPGIGGVMHILAARVFPEASKVARSRPVALPTLGGVDSYLPTSAPTKHAAGEYVAVGVRCEECAPPPPERPTLGV